MAGIGVKLNRIYEKNTLVTHLTGFTYSTIATIAPMLVVILNIVLMGRVLGFSTIGYAERELFSCSVLYIFIFSLLTAAPFNAVLSRYMSDVIYEERYGDILPCFYTGLIMNVLLSCLVGIPFYVSEYLVGHVELLFVFASFCGYIALVFVFYSMLYLSICKEYGKISMFYTAGMLIGFVLSVLLHFLCKVSITYSMLLGLVVGFWVIASMEIALIHSYFTENTREYHKVLLYFRQYKALIVTNFLYILGLYIHNFVFWTTDLKMEVANSYICAQPYDMATCLAMFTNISSSVIFISNIEMRFHERYKKYSEAVIGGRLADINNTKRRMFRQLASELMNLARIQFIISVVVYLLFIVILPQFGFSGLVMQIYPCLAAGYFVLFIMYAAIIFLYYFNDLGGAMLTAIIFCSITLVGSMISSHFDPIWYGMGLLIGAAAGWCVAYIRLRWVERNMDVHVFCRGSLIPKGKGNRPPDKVYDARVQ